MNNPDVPVTAPEMLSEALCRTGLTISVAESKRLIKGGGARVNGQIIGQDVLLVIGAATISAGTKRHAALTRTGDTPHEA